MTNAEARSTLFFWCKRPRLLEDQAFMRSGPPIRNIIGGIKCHEAI